MTRSVSGKGGGGSRPLEGRVAVVAGATRGAGRGIARALGEAGAVVYCTGRSVRGKPSPYHRPETIEETAELVSAAGGRGIAVRVDHGVEAEVKDLFQRAEREQGRLDVLADSVAGQDMILAGWEPTWKTDLSNAELALRQGLLSHVYTAKYAATLMPGVPEVRFHAGALRGHRGELARGCQEGPELPGVRDAAVLRPGRGRWLPTPES